MSEQIELTAEEKALLEQMRAVNETLVPPNQQSLKDKLKALREKNQAASAGS